MRAAIVFALVACSKTSNPPDPSVQPPVATNPEVEPVKVGSQRVHVALPPCAKDDFNCMEQRDGTDDTVDVNMPYPWNEVVGRMAGRQRATLGPLFRGLVLGQPMPASMLADVSTFEKHYLARVHYDVAAPSLAVTFGKDPGLGSALDDVWGHETLGDDAWVSDDGGMVARMTFEPIGLMWTPRRDAGTQ